MMSSVARTLAGVACWLAVGGGTAAAAADGAGATSAISVSRAPFAVVELFTSEGCSSCPPADTVLRGLNASARADGRRVYVLSFHVDYWNRLGWRDPFSDAAYSQRQQRYAQAWASNRIYTPQMVVNGARELVGSRQRTARDVVSAALSAPARVAAGVQASFNAKAQTVDVRWALSSAPQKAKVIVAVTEDGLTRRVTRGENRGRTLRHDGVVRGFAVAAASSAGRSTLEVPDGFVKDRSAVVLFVQDPTTMQILGAAQTRL